MNVLAHVTPQELPIWIAILVAGIGLGIAISLAVIGHVRRKR
jgi:hypothetical protein